MNNRQRFVATMHYQPRDRAPLADFGFWEEPIPLWRAQKYFSPMIGAGAATVLRNLCLTKSR